MSINPVSSNKVSVSLVEESANNKSNIKMFASIVVAAIGAVGLGYFMKNHMNLNKSLTQTSESEQNSRMLSCFDDSINNKICGQTCEAFKSNSTIFPDFPLNNLNGFSGNSKKTQQNKKPQQAEQSKKPEQAEQSKKPQQAKIETNQEKNVEKKDNPPVVPPKIVARIKNCAPYSEFMTTQTRIGNTDLMGKKSKKIERACIDLNAHLEKDWESLQVKNDIVGNLINSLSQSLIDTKNQGFDKIGNAVKAVQETIKSFDPIGDLKKTIVDCLPKGL